MGERKPVGATISVLVHTRNEEVNLPDCLGSVAWADEIVVADMASTDATREIATHYGARVVEVPTVPLVDTVRNLALSHCRGDWVLVLDADERVQPALAERLREIASAGEPAGYALPRRNYFLGEWIRFGFWPDYQIRFFPRGVATWTDMVHEPPRIRGEVRTLPADPQAALEHPGYGDDLSRFIEKLLRYSVQDARRLAETVRPPVWPYLLRRPLAEFYGRYITAQTWRHGMHGLVLSLILAVYQVLIAVHYWTLRTDPAGAPSDPARLRRAVRWEMLRSTVKWLRS